MTDFIDVLEQQLVAAHWRPERRRFVAVPWRATIVFAGAVAAAAVVVIAVLALSSPTPHRAASPPARRTQTAPGDGAAIPTARVQRARVPLAVLNATTVTGLARGAADRLTSAGYHEPNVVTNDVTHQTRATTEIFYEARAQKAAFDVAAILGGRSLVRPMNANARALADRARVAIFVGYDRAR